MSNKISKKATSATITKEELIKVILIFAACVLAAASLPYMMLGKNDGTIFLQWEIYLLLMTVMSIPLSQVLFRQCQSLLPFGKTLGLVLPGFVMWVLGVVFKVPFTNMTGIGVLIAYAVFNVAIYKAANKGQKICLKMVTDGLKKYAKYEIIFYIIFLFWVYLIGFNPSAYGTEKFMDYGFLQKMLVSSKLPPDDVWFAGKPINYYYGGQYYAAFIAKTMIGGISKAEYSYNMMRAVIPALMFMGVFALVEQMLKDRKAMIPATAASGNAYSNKRNYKINFFAALSACVAVFAGNAHYIVYGIIKPLFNVSGEPSGYWFPDATRYIGYNPEVKNDQTIHEFPCYSFVLGDLHAHMINIMFVVLVIALLYSFLKLRKESSVTVKTLWKFPQLFVIGIVWGLFNWTNYWDFIIYIVVIALTIFASNIISEEKWKKIIVYSALQTVMVVVIGVIAVMPFTMNFQSVFKGVGIAEHHSAFYQLCILWGIPVFMVIVFSCVFIAKIVSDSKKEGLKTARCEILPANIFAFILGCSAIGLVIIPELVYVIDIYEATHARANTMFKLTYQSFIMFSVCCGYMLYVLSENKKKVVKVITWILVSLNILMFGYFFNATNSWFGTWTDASTRKGTSALVYLDEEDFSKEKEALLWLKEYSENNEIDGAIAEAPGDSYTAYERASVISGMSTPAGWKVHEWLWRDSLDGISARISDIDYLYSTSTDTEEVKKIIKKYDIEYIFFGTRELEKYGTAVKEDVKKLGDVIYEDDGAFIVKVK